MEKKRLMATILLAIFIITLIIGCGQATGDGTNEMTTTVIKEGVFLDSAVSGLYYECGTLKGTTDSTGKYQYVDGIQVKFKIGGVLIGETTGKSVITPIDVVEGATSVQNVTVQNIVRFLITLDGDNNPDNGITISATISTALQNKTLDFTKTEAEFESLVSAIFANALIEKTLVSTETALNHFNKTLSTTTLNTSVTTMNIDSTTVSSIISTTSTIINNTTTTSTIAVSSTIVVSTTLASTTTTVLQQYSFWYSFGGEFGTEDGQFQDCDKIVMDLTGDIYVLDSNNYRVQKFSKNGDFISKFGSYGASGGEGLETPFNIDVDNIGNTYVANFTNIVSFDYNGVFRFEFGYNEDYGTDYYFQNISDIVSDNSNDIYVSDSSLKIVRKYNSNGAFIKYIGSNPFYNSQFECPVALSIDSQNNLYVLDLTLYQLQVFNSNGDFIKKIEDSSYINDNILDVVYIDNHDNIYLADFNVKYLNKFNSDFEHQVSFNYNIREDYDYFDIIFHNISIDSSGNIYIPDSYNYKIKVFKKNF